MKKEKAKKSNESRYAEILRGVLRLPSLFTLHFSLFTALLCFGLFAQPASAAEAIGQVIGVTGNAAIERPGIAEPIQAAPGVDVYPDDTLATGPSGRVKVFFSGKMVLQVGSDTRVQVSEAMLNANAGERRAAFRLQTGSVRLLVQYLFNIETRARVETPVSVAESRATYFVLAYDPARRRSETLALGGVVGVVGVGGNFGRERLLQPGSLLAVNAEEEPPLPIAADDAARRRLLAATDVPDEGMIQNRVGGENHMADRPAFGVVAEDALGSEGMPSAQEGEAGAEFDALRSPWDEGGLAQEDLPGRPPPRNKPELANRGDNAHVDITIRFPDAQSLRLRHRTRR